MRITIIIACTAIAAACAATSSAQDRQNEDRRPALGTAARPEALSRLVDCRTVADTAERLACYDREVAALDAAEARRELVIVDRQQIRKTRNTLFGLSLPSLSIFGDDSPGEEGVSRIESKIKSFSQNSLGKWTFELLDGARWVQIDSRNLSADPRAGQEIKIRKAAMGSYLANVNGQIAIRVRRVN